MESSLDPLAIVSTELKAHNKTEYAHNFRILRRLTENFSFASVFLIKLQPSASVLMQVPNQYQVRSASCFALGTSTVVLAGYLRAA